MNTIEVEVRSFITQEQHEALLERFAQEGKLISEDEQETFYFASEQDVRIQRNNAYSKIWMKKGKMHDPHREEVEVRFAREDFDKLEQVFLAVGLTVDIKWFRKRSTFDWQDVTVCIDATKGYGFVIELEQMSSAEEQERVYAELQQKLQELGIPSTPKAVFDERFAFYKEHWRELVSET